MFRLNRLTDYAVVLMSQMAERGGEVRQAPRIAEETGVPLPTVAKILNALNKADLVTSHRGAAGGYTLSRAAEDISVSQIIQALEGPIALTACVDSAPESCESEHFCPMRGHWEKVNRAIQDALEGVSLAEMRITGFDFPPAAAPAPTAEKTH